MPLSFCNNLNAMKIFLPLTFLLLLNTFTAKSQCNSGSEAVYGTNNVWIGYVYNNANLGSFRGRVNEGAAASPNFDQDFGGSDVNYALIGGCTVKTEKFSIRYRLSKTFTSGNYIFTVGGDDGYRLSLDGGATWVINRWTDQTYITTTYTTTLNGSYNMVLEYYGDKGENRISFSLTASCSATENTSIYGTANTWNGYVYDGINFNIYTGMVQEGSASNPSFDENFGGGNVSYSTSGCAIQTETFSVRYRLNKTFTAGTYLFAVGGDDGYRLSLDGGATWVINRWTDQSYTSTAYSATLDGSYNMVLEYYENGGENRISFSLVALCSATENTSISGTANIWNGYVYDGTNFDTYVGMVQNGSASDPAFDENFGGATVSYPTSGCAIQTETFSVRYRLSKTFAAGTYMFTVGADDGYRLSLNGGSTWIINNWGLHSYTTTSYSASLSGTYDMVLEYYENAVDNRVSFAMQTLSILPITLESFTAKEKEHTVQLNWDISSNSNPRSFEIEKSIDATSFSGIGTVLSNANSATQYSFTDQAPFRGMAYYRLKMTDMNGITTYSATISIRLAAASANKINIYPTIVTGNSFFVTAGSNIRNAVITITSLNGNIITKQNAGNITAGQAVRVSTGAANTGKGIYAVIISGSDFGITSGKIVIP